MEKTKEQEKFNTGEPQVLRKAEIARILSSVKQAPFNAKDSNKSTNSSFQKRSLLDIALDASKNEVINHNQEGEIGGENSGQVNTETDGQNNELEDVNKNNNLLDQENNEAEDQNNFNEESKRQLIEENNALIEERIKEAEKNAFEEGKKEGLKEGHVNGISEARAQSQEGLDAAISIFRIAAETIDNSDQSNLEVLNEIINKTVLEIAKESTGFIIDTLPEKFVSRINDFSKLINENFKKISLVINSEDFSAIKDFIEKDEFLSSLNIKPSESLSRGDMKLNADGIKVDDICKFGNIEVPKINPNPLPSAPASEEQSPPEENSSNDEQPSTPASEEQSPPEENSSNDEQPSTPASEELIPPEENSSNDEQPSTPASEEIEPNIENSLDNQQPLEQKKEENEPPEENNLDDQQQLLKQMQALEETKEENE
jgi:flagellar biosynthesis/type III secretory pathway protein FliH